MGKTLNLYLGATYTDEWFEKLKRGPLQTAVADRRLSSEDINYFQSFLRLYHSTFEESGRSAKRIRLTDGAASTFEMVVIVSFSELIGSEASEVQDKVNRIRKTMNQYVSLPVDYKCATDSLI
jgi:hypothetical protein